MDISLFDKMPRGKDRYRICIRVRQTPMKGARAFHCLYRFLWAIYTENLTFRALLTICLLGRSPKLEGPNLLHTLSPKSHGSPRGNKSFIRKYQSPSKSRYVNIT